MSRTLVINDDTNGAVMNSISSFYGTGLTQGLNILGQSVMFIWQWHKQVEEAALATADVCFHTTVEIWE